MAAKETIKLIKRLAKGIAITTTGFGLYFGGNIYRGNEEFYEEHVVNTMMKLEPEVAHKLTIRFLKYLMIPSSKYVDTPLLAQNIKHLTFRNPIGIAAGFDKNGEAVKGLEKIGFGFVEIGSVTPKAQDGNPHPRIFRLPQNYAIINRCGFNSDGHEVVYKRLKKLRETKSINCVLGVNLGKNKFSEGPIDDYVKGIQKFADVADYFAINVSSPNTPGLRDLQKKENLKNLLSAVISARNDLPNNLKPLIFLKLSPDLKDQEKKDIANVIKDKKCLVDGLIISNTTIERNPYLVSEYANEMGGLSGEPLKSSSTKLIKEMYTLTRGSVPIIGTGGVFDGIDAYEKIKAGASLVQLYTSLVYKGPSVVPKIKEQLYSLVKTDGYGNISEAVGKSTKK